MHAFKALLALALALALAVAQAEVDDKLSVSGGGNRAMLSGLVFIDELQQTSGMVVGGLGCRPRALCCDGEIPFEKTTGLSGGSWAVAVNEAIGAKEALKRFRDYVTARSEHTLGEAVSGVQLGIKGDPRLSNSLVSGARERFTAAQWWAHRRWEHLVKATIDIPLNYDKGGALRLNELRKINCPEDKCDFKGLYHEVQGEFANRKPTPLTLKKGEPMEYAKFVDTSGKFVDDLLKQMIIAANGKFTYDADEEWSVDMNKGVEVVLEGDKVPSDVHIKKSVSVVALGNRGRQQTFHLSPQPETKKEFNDRKKESLTKKELSSITTKHLELAEDGTIKMENGEPKIASEELTYVSPTERLTHFTRGTLSRGATFDEPDFSHLDVVREFFVPVPHAGETSSDSEHLVRRRFKSTLVERDDRFEYKTDVAAKAQVIIGATMHNKKKCEQEDQNLKELKINARNSVIPECPWGKDYVGVCISVFSSDRGMLDCAMKTDRSSMLERAVLSDKKSTKRWRFGFELKKSKVDFSREVGTDLKLGNKDWKRQKSMDLGNQDKQVVLSSSAYFALSDKIKKNVRGVKVPDGLEVTIPYAEHVLENGKTELKPRSAGFSAGDPVTFSSLSAGFWDLGPTCNLAIPIKDFSTEGTTVVLDGSGGDLLSNIDTCKPFWERFGVDCKLDKFAGRRKVQKDIQWFGKKFDIEAVRTTLGENYAKHVRVYRCTEEEKITHRNQRELAWRTLEKADKDELDAAQLKVDNAKAAVDTDKDDAAAADTLKAAREELKVVRDKQVLAPEEHVQTKDTDDTVTVPKAEAKVRPRTLVVIGIGFVTKASKTGEGSKLDKIATYLETPEVHTLDHLVDTTGTENPDSPKSFNKLSFDTVDLQTRLLYAKLLQVALPPTQTAAELSKRLVESKWSELVKHRKAVNAHHTRRTKWGGLKHRKVSKENEIDYNKDALERLQCTALKCEKYYKSAEVRSETWVK